MKRAGSSFSGGESKQLVEVLSELKQIGSNILITGEVAPNVSFHATQELLGSTNKCRERLLVSTDLTIEPDHYLRQGYVPAPRVIDFGTDQLRGASAAENPSLSTPTPKPLIDSRLRPLQTRICEEIADLDEEYGDLESSQLRMSLLTLRPIVERFDYYDAARFIRIIGGLVKGVEGMAHYHLPIDDDDPLVEEFKHLFDARVELRRQGDIPTEQRWHIPQINYSTEWVRL